MIKFATRTQARNFAKGKKKVIDLLKEGSLVDIFKISAGYGSRWAVVILNKA
jgi:hypothetical protein